MTSRFLSLLIGFVIVAGLAAPAAAQGNSGKGRPKAPKESTPTSTSGSASGTTSTTSTSATTPIDGGSVQTSVGASTSFRQFGSWLDDASAPVPGEGYTSISVGHWRMNGMTQTNMPMLGAGLGLTDRLQVGASVPFYRVNYGTGTASGLDDIYLNAKFTIVDPALTVSEFGLSVSPVLEVLSAGATDGRVHFAIPASVEFRRAPYRVYGSAGYFSRGAFFSGAALEWTSRSNFTLTGSLTQSYSLPDDEQLNAMQVARQRMDVSASIAYPMLSNAVVFGSVGRSLSSIADGGTRLAVTGGVSIRFSAPRATP